MDATTKEREMKEEVRNAIDVLTAATANCVEGDRHLVVLDKGFIFAGNLSKKDDVYTLTNCFNVRKWSTGGFGGLSKSANESGATLDPSAPIRFEPRAMVFCVPISGDWDA